MKKDLPLPPGKVLPTTESVAGKAGSRTLRYDDFAVNDTPLSAVNDEWPGHFLKKPVTSDPILPKRPETDPLPLSWWRRWESNPRPEASPLKPLRA